MRKSSIEYLEQITAYRPIIYAFIRSVAPALRDNAEDVLQETNITLWNLKKGFKPGSNFKAFTFRIAYLKTLEALRKQRRTILNFEEEKTLEAILGFYENESFFDSTDLHEALKKCLASLSPEHRELLNERYWEGRTVREIADRLGKSEGALQQLFFRLRKTLHNRIEKCLVEGQS